MRKVSLVALIGVAFAALFSPAKAATQVIDATLAPGVSMTAVPTPNISWALAMSGANTTSGGSMTVSANTPYTVTMSAEKDFLTQHNGTGYVSGGSQLSSPLTVTAARTGGTAVVPGVGLVLPASTIGGPIGTGTGLGTDTFSLTLSQPTVITDKALPTGHTYHNVLTYTASATL
ncbi:MAG TPA: hypothetical protein VHJ82_06340 [Actinomycetota bacterium]|nr:hypothetical protein [Actinomycetota bacterium]